MYAFSSECENSLLQSDSACTSFYTVKHKHSTVGARRNILDWRETFLSPLTFTTFILPTQTQRGDTGFDFGCLLCVAFGTINRTTDAVWLP